MSGDEEHTIFCRNLAEKVTEAILYELFLQAGPLEDVRIPTTLDGKSRNFGFVVYKHKCSVKYAMELFRNTNLYGRVIALQNKILDAERYAEIRSRMLDRRNDEINALRGGLPVFSRLGTMSSKTGSPENSREHDFNPLRGGPIGFSRNNMAPRGFSDNMLRQYSPKSDGDGASMDPRLANPYSSSFINSFLSSTDSRGSSSFQRHGGRSPYDRSDRHSRDSRTDRDYSRFEQDHSRHSRDHDKKSERGHSDLRHRMRRSRSRDRSPHKNDRYRRR